RKLVIEEFHLIAVRSAVTCMISLLRAVQMIVGSRPVDRKGPHAITKRPADISLERFDANDMAGAALALGINERARDFHKLRFVCLIGFHGVSHLFALPTRTSP